MKKLNQLTAKNYANMESKTSNTARARKNLIKNCSI